MTTKQSKVLMPNASVNHTKGFYFAFSLHRKRFMLICLQHMSHLTFTLTKIVDMYHKIKLKMILAL